MAEKKAKQDGSQSEGRCVGGDNERCCGRPMKSEGREEEDERGEETWVRVKELGNKKKNKLSEEGRRQEQQAH